MKKLTVVVIVLMLTLANTWAGEMGKPQLKGSWRSEAKSSYITDFGIVVHNDMVWENELNLRLGETGVYGGVWSAFPFEKAKPVEATEEKAAEAPTFKDERLTSLYQLVDSTKQLYQLLHPAPKLIPPFEGEIDLYVGYTKKFERLTLDTSLWYYDFNKVGKYNDDQWGAQLVATYTDFKWVEPYLRINCYEKTGSQSPRGGWYIYPGANFHVPLGFKLAGEKAQTLDLGVHGAWSNGVLGMDSGYVYARLSASTDFQIRKNVFIAPSIMYQIASPGQAGGDKDYVDGNKWRFGLGCRIEF